MKHDTDVRGLYVLLCGYEIIPRSISLRGADPRFLHAVPITAYLIDTKRGWVLFDTALDPANLDDPARRAACFTDQGWDPPPAVLPHHRLEAQLDAIGVALSDIKTVILSHLHADHSGYLKHLDPQRVLIQRAEFAHAFSDKASPAWFRDDYDLPGVNWEVIEGDAEVMPGLSLLFTPGHTPGHQSALLVMPQGAPVILAADVGDMWQNFHEELLPGEAADDAAALASLRRLNTLQRELGAQMLLTHDPDQIRVIPLAPLPYG